MQTKQNGDPGEGSTPRGILEGCFRWRELSADFRRRLWGFQTTSRLSPRGERFLFREKYPGLLSRLERNKMNGTVLNVRGDVERKISMVLCVYVFSGCFRGLYIGVFIVRATIKFGSNFYFTLIKYYESNWFEISWLLIWWIFM